MGRPPSRAAIKAWQRAVIDAIDQRKQVDNVDPRDEKVARLELRLAAKVNR